MDRGAHFFRTDLQVHTPRDGRWSGSCCGTSDSERMEFARLFVDECRLRKLDAIAVTDHDDMCFVPFIQAAAQGGITPDDRPDPSKQRPMVFPGVEVLLKVPCQVLVILDADADSEVQKILLHALGITPASASTPHGPKPSECDHNLISSLKTALDGRHELKGRYIILPHVTPGGHKTLLRDGFMARYIEMACCGGYIECDIDKVNQGKINILNGEDTAWGSKPLGIFQTSDARTLDDIAKRSTWVKLSEPTAEALRQACLARHTRIMQVEPKLPTSYIAKVVIKGSGFMEDMEIEFNPQLNTLIGGRGTGKSTILEYIRWAMHDQPEPDERESYARMAEERREFVKETLEASEGSVEVHWMVNGSSHKLRRDVAARERGEETTINIKDEGVSTISPEEARKLLPIRAFSQKELSAVGTATRELTRFVKRPIAAQLEEARIQAEDQAERAHDAYSKVVRRQRDQAQLEAVITELRSARSRADAIDKSLPEVSEQSRAIINEHPVRLVEATAVAAILEDIDHSVTNIKDAEASLKGLPRSLALSHESPQSVLLSDMHQSAAKSIGDTVEALLAKLAELRETSRAMRVQEQEWRIGHEAFMATYENAQVENAKAHEEIAMLKQVRETISELETKETKLLSVLEQDEDAEQEFQAAWRQWADLHKARSDLLETACDNVNERSGGDVKTTVRRGADCETAIEKLTGCLRGTGIGAKKTEIIEEALRDSREPIELWRKVLGELRVFAEVNSESPPPEANLPSLKIIDLTAAQKSKLARKLDPETWISLALTSLDDETSFMYVGGGQDIRFEHASSGQQATALLRVLLRDADIPLIIDQPEDDLDNVVINEIIDGIRSAKSRRQLIFASHNANLVVNGDSELIALCKCRSSNGMSHGYVHCEGAIDAKDVRDAITEVMEGGEEAFELRRKKYGF